MPVKLKQWHYAQAPASWYTALVTVRLHNAHLKALSLYYNNVISDDPSPSRARVHKLYDQIVASQKQYIVAKEALAVISEDLKYFEDPDRMTWATRPDRRGYEYDSVQVNEQERGNDAEQQMIWNLSEATPAAIFHNGSSDDNDSDTSSQSSDSNSNSSTSTCATTPPSSPPTLPLTPSPSSSPKSKHVRFAPGILSPTGRRGVMRIRTSEEVEEEFQAANTLVTKILDSQENSLKRKRSEDGDVEFLAKRLKRLHSRRWPEAYYEDV